MQKSFRKVTTKATGDFLIPLEALSLLQKRRFIFAGPFS